MFIITYLWEGKNKIADTHIFSTLAAAEIARSYQQSIDDGKRNFQIMQLTYEVSQITT